MVTCILIASATASVGFLAGSLLAGAKHSDEALHCLVVVDAARQFSRKYSSHVGDTPHSVTIDKGDLDRLRQTLEWLDRTLDEDVAPAPAPGFHKTPRRSNRHRHQG